MTLKQYFTIAIACLIAVTVIACSSSKTTTTTSASDTTIAKPNPPTSPIYIPTAENITCDTAMIPMLTRGRTLYMQTCAACHKLYLPERFTADQWTVNVRKMQPKARISDAVRDSIYQYLTCIKK